MKRQPPRIDSTTLGRALWRPSNDHDALKVHGQTVIVTVLRTLAHLPGSYEIRCLGFYGIARAEELWPIGTWAGL